MKKLYFLILLLAPLLLTDCSSGKKSFEKGNYYDAVIKAVNRLRQNPNHKKSQETLREGYPLALKTLEQNAVNALNSHQQFRYKHTLRQYELINTMYEEIRRAPGALKVVRTPKNYYDKLPDLKQRAAEESYIAGVEALNRDTRQDAKRAFHFFQDVNSFVPGYKDVAKKLDESYFMATLKVIVERIPVPSRYRLSADFFQDQIEDYLHSQAYGNQFVRFYTPQEAESEKLPFVDQYLRLEFDNFVVGETHVLKEIENISRDSVKIGSVTVNGEKVDAYGTVNARLTRFKKEVISKGLFSMKIYDAKSNAVLNHRKFDGEFVWFTSWGNFSGDERALSDEQLKMCEGHDVPPPPPQEMFIEFTKPIYGQLTNAIQAFYRQY